MAVADKYNLVKEAMAGKADSLLITTLDDIMWLSNLRGTDIENNPLFISYAVFNASGEAPSLVLFVNPEKVKAEDIKKHLTDNKITAKTYEEAFAHVKTLSETKKLAYDDSACNQSIF